MKFLAASLAFLAGCLALTGCKSTAPSAAAPRGPLLGLQAYTYRNLTLAETVEKAEALGIRYLQLYPRQRLRPEKPGQFLHMIDETTRANLLAHAKAHHVEFASYGVVTGKDEADWRQIFIFARAMGMQSIATEAPESAFPLLAQLSAESGVAVSLHNHPVPSRYADPDVALAAIKSYPSFGLCADTGHWARSGYNPVAALRKAAGRITSLHFKDIPEIGVKESRDVPWGTGVCDLAGQMLELRRQGFMGIAFAEYEHLSPNLDTEVAQSVEFFRRLTADSDEDLVSRRAVPPGFTRKIADLWADARGRDAQRWPSPRPLFSADLSDAEFISGSWAWEDGVLVSKGGGDLWTKAIYGDFALSLEFRCDTGADSGVHLRCSDLANPAQSSLELQILPSTSDDSMRINGAILGCVPPYREIRINPGEWHRYVIVARGSVLSVSLDHEPVIKISLAKWLKPHLNPDGSSNPYDIALRDLPPSGQIGLQGSEKPIAFRNLRIDPL